MIRRRWIVALIALSVLSVCTAAAAAAGTQPPAPQLIPIGRSHPTRGFLVSFGRSTSVTRGDVSVSENGRPVKRFSFVPVATSHEHVGVVLVLDASNSMRGRPESDAFAAARTFVQRLAAHEPVALLTFSKDTRLLLRPTRSPAVAVGALRDVPATQEGTHIYDAVDAALALLKNGGYVTGSVIVLSDGVDTGSQLTRTQVEQRARRDHVRVFTIGLNSSVSDAAPLEALARDTNAVYSRADSSAELKATYDTLEGRLASDYLLLYRSQARPGDRVQVHLVINGSGEASYSYSVPTSGVIHPYHRSIASRFWGWRGSFVVISLLAGVLIFLALSTLLHRPPSQLPSRLRQFISLSPEADLERRRPRVLLMAKLYAAVDEALSRTDWYRRLQREVEIAEAKVDAPQLVGSAIVATLLVFFLLLLTVPVFSVFALAVPLTARSLHKYQLQRVREQFAEQLPDNLQVLASALRAGHSFIAALAVVAADADWPAKREFERVVADEQLGVPVENALRDSADRMRSPDLEQLALVAELQRQVGGNMAEVLDRVVETIRARFDLRRLVKTLTAQGRMARWIVSLLPVALAAFISVVNPHYLSPLTGSSGGQVTLVIAVALLVGGSLVIKRIVTIEV